MGCAVIRGKDHKAPLETKPVSNPPGQYQQDDPVGLVLARKKTREHVYVLKLVPPVT